MPASAHSTELASPGIDVVEEVTYKAESEVFVEKCKLQASLYVILDSTWFVLLCRGDAMSEFMFHSMQDVSSEDRRTIMVPTINDVANTIVNHDKSRKNLPNKWRPTGTYMNADAKEQAKYHAHLDERQRTVNASCVA